MLMAREVVDAMTAAYDAGNWEAFGQCLHDDAVMEFMGQRYEGRDAIVEHQRSNPTTVERRDWVVSDDERVWLRWTVSFDVEDGRRVTTTGVGMSQVRDDRVAHLAMWIDLTFMLPPS